jgi:L-threonylcarbamoyladenylate synthase
MIISQYHQNAINLAIEKLQQQKLIAIPTDTIYGLAVDASSFEAVEKLYELKKRDNQKPIAIFTQNLEMAKEIFCFNKLAEKIATLYMPGKITMILNTKENNFNLAKNLNYRGNKIGFRYINSFFISKLLANYQKPLAVTSANISGCEVAKSAADITKIFNLELVIDSEEISNNLASTVIEITENNFKILRQGEIMLNNTIST